MRRENHTSRTSGRSSGRSSERAPGRAGRHARGGKDSARGDTFAPKSGKPAGKPGFRDAQAERRGGKKAGPGGPKAEAGRSFAKKGAAGAADKGSANKRFGTKGTGKKGFGPKKDAEFRPRRAPRREEAAGTLSPATPFAREPRRPDAVRAPAPKPVLKTIPATDAGPDSAKSGGVKLALVAGDEDGIRVDRWFSRYYPGLTHGMLEKMLRTGQIRVNGKRIRAKDRMMTDDEIRLPPQLVYGTLDEKPKKHAALKMDGSMLQDRVIYMDGSVIVINKPSGLATQGGSGLTEHVDGMLDSLMFEKKQRPRLVHRLDKDTSGVLVIARNASAAAILSKSLAERDASKVYWALTKGVPSPRRGVIKAALVKEGGHGPRGRDERMMVTDKDTDGAKSAATAYAVMGEAGEYAWVACKPLTGRTHQIRVHLASIGTPIVGDFKYGGTDARGHGDIEDRLHLHARMIDMAAPDQVRLHAVAELPEHMKKTWALFGFDADSTEDPFAKARKKK